MEIEKSDIEWLITILVMIWLAFKKTNEKNLKRLSENINGVKQSANQRVGGQLQ